VSVERDARDRIVAYFLSLSERERAAYLVGLAMGLEPKRVPTTVIARLIPDEVTP
jgi:hypothetical protein